ncbi:uncharacterized protein EI90DRAFT_776371 [Cantharellus anzutake]|uniref:uncharacterized protein n=1 Tax=Cantharellus anzutake TaxID=1750568 RepID=UPI0019036D41|nr:uncharacterized protein EI90DRAFT_776371 [Cantharellus anzutake]KAF8342692.1 hypothetical protein EI90DRAFT_776371 [Cantharellus anzutake]
MVAFPRVTTILFPLAAVLIPSVSAQNMPTCGRTCMQQALSGSGCKSLDDASCICTNASFLETSSSCAVGSCTPNDFDQYTYYLLNFCDRYDTTTLSATDPGGVTSLESPPGSSTSPGGITSTKFGGPTSSPVHKSGAAVPGAKVFSGSNGILAVILGGIVFGAHVAGLR